MKKGHKILLKETMKMMKCELCMQKKNNNNKYKKKKKNRKPIKGNKMLVPFVIALSSILN